MGMHFGWLSLIKFGEIRHGKLNLPADLCASGSSLLSLNYTHAVAGCYVPLVGSFKASGAAGTNEICR
jgi:hypothetical protein